MKTIANLKSLFVILLLDYQGLAAHAAGTIVFANGTLTRVEWNVGSTPIPTVYGVFWGTNRDDLTLALPLGTSSTTASGIIVAPSVYAISGTEAGQTVYLQIKGWSAAYGTNWMEARLNFAGYGETDIRQVTLGPAAGPGTVIWQGSTGTNPNRFRPLVLGNPLTPPAIVHLGSPPNSPVTVDEGNQGTVDAIIPVTRYTYPLAPTNLNFISTVMVSTTNMTALDGQDYVPTNVVVTFNPGETLRYVRIKIIADASPEPDEQFGVYLSSTGSFVSVDQYVLTVNIREARLLSVRRDAGQPVVTLRTTISQRYTLESSSDLNTWSVVPGAEDIAGTGGPVQVVDPSPDCCGHRFYRVQLLTQ